MEMDWIPQIVRDVLAVPAARAGLAVLVALVAALMTDFVLTRAIPRLTRMTRTTFDDRLIRQLRRPVFLSVLLVGVHAAVAILEPPLGVLNFCTSTIKTAAVLIWLFAGLRLCSTAIDGLSRLAGRVTWFDERTVPLFDNLAKIVLFGGAIYALLRAWNLDVAPWLASAGIVGIAVGFAAKDSLANLFGGLFIVIDAPYKIGDFINLDGGERGMVTKIGLRSTRLITRDDVEITVPNAQIANSKIINESGGPSEKARVEIRVGVAYGSDVDRVREILERSARAVPDAAKDPAPRIRFLEMGDSALIFRVMCWVDEPVLRGSCIDGLNTVVYKNLVAEKITIPFPQRDVHIHQPPVAAAQV